jgi:protein phosphatase 1 regulatory subunit 7
MKRISREPKPHKVVLDRALFTSNLSALGFTATGEFAYLRLSLESQALESIQGIENFPHLQHINLSNNRLSTLKPLSQIRHLLTLDVSHNQLTTLLDFSPPANLLSVNASHNLLKSFGNISKNQFLQQLFLDFNQISEIEGIEELPNLQVLSLCNNKILRIGGLPVSIQRLNLSNNDIKRLGIGFEKLVFLRAVDLSYNKLHSLKGTEGLESLMILLLKGNQFRKINTLDHLVDLALLSDLDLSENLATEKEHYRLRVAFKLPQLRKLDGVQVSAEEKIKAENLFGLDIEDRKALFTQIFPGQMFVDRRLVKSEMLDIESESEAEEELPSVKNSSQGSKIGSRNLSKVASRENMDPMAMSDILAFSKRYVGDLIEKEEEERNTRVNFEVYE